MLTKLTNNPTISLVPHATLSLSLSLSLCLSAPQGSEGVDIKEGSFGNLVYENLITGQQVVDAGGMIRYLTE